MIEHITAASDASANDGGIYENLMALERRSATHFLSTPLKQGTCVKMLLSANLPLLILWVCLNKHGFSDDGACQTIARSPSWPPCGKN